MNFFIFVTTCDPRMKNCVFLNNCFICECFAIHVCMRIMCVQCLQRPEEGDVNWSL